MPVYVCRWPNGDVSAVFARNHEVAVEMLDEVGNADDGIAEIFEAPRFMVHFKLCENACASTDNDIPVELERFGEEFWSQLMEKAYPEYYEETLKDDMTIESIERALQRERERLA